jgi:hypothetical protein
VVERGGLIGEATSEAERVKQLERDNRELRRANEILKVAGAFFPGGARSPRPRHAAWLTPPVTGSNCRLVLTGHDLDKSDAHRITSGASSRTRPSVMRAVGP